MKLLIFHVLAFFCLIKLSTEVMPTYELLNFASCSAASNFVPAQYCQLQLNINFPINVSTELTVEIISSDLNISFAQLCYPTFNTGSNLVFEKTNVSMISSSNTKQFDQMIIDFGTVVSNNDASANASILSINFNMVILATQDNGTVDLIVGAEYDGSGQFWILDGISTYTYVADPTTSAVISTRVNSTSNGAEVGKIGTFRFVATATTLFRYQTVNVTAQSLSKDVTVCSIHVELAQSCFTCLDSLKTFYQSTESVTDNTIVYLDLGGIPSSGVASGVFSNSTDTVFLVVYRIWSTATPGSTHKINVTFSITKDTGTTKQTYFQLVTVTASSPTDASSTAYPDVTASLVDNIIPIHAPFFLTISVDFPYGFSNFVSFNIRSGNYGTVPVMKVCGIDVTWNGENVPCKRCLGLTNTTLSSMNSPTNGYDIMTWEIPDIIDTQLRGINEVQNPTRIDFKVTMQVLDVLAAGSNGSVIAYLIFGSDTVWIDKFDFIVATANYTNTTITTPTFNISYADNWNTTAEAFTPRLIYLDIITQPLTIYQKMDLEVLVPETDIASNIPAATICKVEIFYVGQYVNCVQKSLINDLTNAQIAYSKRMVRFKKDKAAVTIGSICNTAPDMTTAVVSDHLVRLLLYVQLEDEAPTGSSNYINFATIYSPYDLFAGSILLTKLATIIKPLNKAVYAYTNNEISPYGNLTVIGATLGIANYVFKIPPYAKASYSFEIALNTNGLTAGNAKFCTFLFTSQGNYVPCSSPAIHKYSYNSITYNKIGDNANAGVVCSINNITSLLTTNDTFDLDSVNVEFVTLSSRDANGQYDLTIKLYDTTNLQSLNSTKFNWMVTPGPSYNISSTTSSTDIYMVDPFSNLKLDSSIFPYFNEYFFESQTSIIRFNLTVNQTNSFNLTLELTIYYMNNTIDQFDLQKFYISSVGDNLPCTKSQRQIAYFKKGYLYNYSAILPVGDICYYPFEPTNLTANTIAFDAHIRIPMNSSLYNQYTSNEMLTATVTATIDGNKIDIFTKNYSGQPNRRKGYWISAMPNKNYTLNVTNNTNVTVRQTVKFRAILNLPPLTNYPITIKMNCSDATNNYEICNIKSFKIVSMGANVDGPMTDFNHGLIPITMSTASNDSYYNNSAFLDMGIVTNTMYTININEYNASVDDQIIIEYELLIGDDKNLVHLAAVKPTLTVEVYMDKIVYQNTTFIMLRNGSEKPNVTFESNVMNSTLYGTGDTLQIKVKFYHDPSSLAEAHNVTIRYYLPSYVEYKNISFQNTQRTIYDEIIPTYLTFTYDTLYFDEIVEFIFELSIDPYNEYSNYIRKFDRQPSNIEIFYDATYQKVLRTSPIIDSTTQFYAKMASITYEPRPVQLISYNAFVNQLISCQVTASVFNNLASNLFQTGWTISSKSLAWYTNGFVYVTIGMGNVVNVRKIVLSQLTGTGTTRFSKFIISYANDTSTDFAELPETSFPKNITTYTLYLPSNGILCRYLRIKITNVFNSSELATKLVGLIVNEIYGNETSTGVSALSACQSLIKNTSSTSYSPRSVMYVPTTKTLYVCDLKVQRTKPSCYKTTDSNVTYWQILPSTVVNVISWIYDFELTIEYLYGIGYDQITYVRSDDGGSTWKSVSSLEFNTVIFNVRVNPFKFTYSTYQPIPIDSTPIYIFNNWKTNPVGLTYNNVQQYYWF